MNHLESRTLGSTRKLVDFILGTRYEDIPKESIERSRALVCEVACASGFASSMDGDVLWDTRSIVWRAQPNSIILGKGNLGTHIRAPL